MPYESPAALRSALDARLQNEARQRGTRLDRLRRRAVFERLLIRLDVGRPNAWVLKGGTALEVRWRERARATRDLDLAYRDKLVDGGALRALVIDQLSRDPDGDRFRFEVSRVSPLADDMAGRPAWRLPVRALLAGREFASVRVDIVARSEELVITERLLLPGVLSFAGYPSRDIEVVAPAQHFAEKLHALTRRWPDRENTRVRDLVDLIMLIEDGRLEPRQVRQVARHVFTVRGLHALPDDLPDPPASWSATYAMLANELDIAATDIVGAMASLRRFWAATRED
jgi:predicted nucleotidyltransferase component of viral defense system